MVSINGKMLNILRYHALARRLLRRLQKGDDFAKVRERFYDEYWRNAAHDSGADIESIGQSFYVLTRDGRSTYVQYHYVSLDSYLNLSLVGYKPLIHKLLSAHGYPVPRYRTYRMANLRDAAEFMRNLDGSFVVKPTAGSGGLGITTGINDYQRLRTASITAAAATLFQQRLIIEEEIQGDSFRLLYLNGELIDAVRRLPPGVVGDGKSTIKKLIIEEKFRRWEADKIQSLNPLTIDLDCKFTLQDNGYCLKSVLAQNECLSVKKVVNENARRENTSVKTEVHPYFVSLGKHISSILDLELVGIDVITPDITVPLDESGGVVNEINIPPGLHYHELITNESDKAPVAEMILDYIFRRARRRYGLNHETRQEHVFKKEACKHRTRSCQVQAH